MDFRDVLLMQHAVMHTGAVAAAPFSLAETRLRGLTDAECRRQPRPGTNSIAWILWHTARIEDVAANVLVADRGQVLDDGGWEPRLTVRWRDVGTGMTLTEVAELSAAIDLDAVRGYRDAVGRRTREVLQALPLATLDERLPASRIDRLRAEGAVRPDAWRLAEIWAAWPTALLLAMPAIAHSAVHWGEADVLRGLLSTTAG